MVCYILKNGTIKEGERHEDISGNISLENNLHKDSTIKYSDLYGGIWVGIERATPKQERAIVNFCLKYRLPLPFEFER